MKVTLFLFFLSQIKGLLTNNDKKYSFVNKPLHMKLNSRDIDLYDRIAAPESITELLDDVDMHHVKEAFFTSDLKKIYSVYKNNENIDDKSLYNLRLTYTNPSLTQNFLDNSRKANVKTFILPEQTTFTNTLSQITGLLGGFFSTGFYFILLISLVTSLMRNNRSSGMPGGMNPFSGTGGPGAFFGGGRDIKKDKENMIKANITLSDWAGSPEVFQECSEVVTYLKNDTNYKAAGAEVPRGILLEGPPGTGKTLLAKAIASECDANFISVASSEFVEVFVGLGAQKVRNLFKQARENIPCVLFIDEIDSIGKQRGTGVNLGNDEREQTLNQLLAEMDGFNNNEGVLILAATNRKDVLDSALLRPGRFDRTIAVPLPDKESRKEIFKVHTQNKEIEKSIEYEFLAELSNGFSGAQIKNLVNEGAILAAREGRTIITQNDLEQSLEKMVVGIVKKNDTRSEATRTRVAIHEAGHALLAALHSEYFDLKKATIQATYNGAGGYTLFNEKRDVAEEGLYTKEAFKKRLIVSMGGKAAESIFYGDDFVSLGAVQDLKTANQLAQSMIGNYGMGEELKVFYNENTETGRNPFLGRSLAMGDKYSEKTKELMDKESLFLVNNAYKEASKILSINKEILATIANILTTQETISGEIIMNILIEKTQNQDNDV
jgi:cell division protease FtsH